LRSATSSPLKARVGACADSDSMGRWAGDPICADGAPGTFTAGRARELVFRRRVHDPARPASRAAVALGPISIMILFISSSQRLNDPMPGRPPNSTLSIGHDDRFFATVLTQHGNAKGNPSNELVVVAVRTLSYHHLMNTHTLSNKTHPILTPSHPARTGAHFLAMRKEHKTKSSSSPTSLLRHRTGRISECAASTVSKSVPNVSRTSSGLL